jgi:[NiFe] hydrogenase assembly HybE family chaperone
VGVLITPWFMNLICLPSPASTWDGLPSGTKQNRDLPSGGYEFLTAEEDELGPYLTSSLFSPMFDFPDMARAREVAVATLSTVFGPAESEPASAPPTPQPVGLVAKLEQPVSRRGFFGALLRPGGKT